jgi:hypothetical protein
VADHACGANIGWINFETNGALKVDLFTGKLRGSVWSANCGWISLSNAVTQVQTDTIAEGLDSDHNASSESKRSNRSHHRVNHVSGFQTGYSDVIPTTAYPMSGAGWLR